MNEADFADLKTRLWTFMEKEIYPNEMKFVEQSREIGESGNEWTHAPILVELKRKAKAAKLWNMFLPVDSAEVAGEYGKLGGGLTNRQYGEICEILGTSVPMEFASQATNCTSPDTGNMEVLARYGTPEQRQKWLVPLLEGTIRSAYAMTEPAVASSDATNISIHIDRDEKRGEYVINGRKWYITGAGSLHCKIMIVMGKTNNDPNCPVHKTTSQILVPMDTPGITILRPMLASGDDDAPKGHMDMLFEDVRVPFENVLLGEGRGFEISQGRLGPGRIHHCMRAIGQAERSLSLMCKRVQERTAFGKKLSQFDTILQDIAKSRADIETCRLLVYKAADLMDQRGNKDAYTRQLLSLVKAHIPITVQGIVDKCIQAHGAMGISQDTPLWFSFVGARWLRIADGPDEVHWRTAARIELRRQKDSPLSKLGHYLPDRNKIFRRSTDPISPKTQELLKNYSKL
mmetsp:Transcript_7381/g.8926  ORF Transcript_7381/g.8926 Transcript_7381/m.8926 type:complete len:459 (-) Transcript_7381:82-1458(-)|eukprot:CAMPEP_0204834296 /NCGR_PEP_ID=MMETSP1346-20131115/19469_1 /ASSEMBLY_ACC=CAM_ASM_000771 /TAXON_ID=215587 /ORGANISM="Aplanochytrium stocchinoi, Strain GSBS06" /LENGTH=458 /DNA_ID=CAMNT_0051967531 /DNA_START=80 /DNA_END=1456 /DNA_ORIENTATION=+